MTIESTLERIANALESLDEKIGCLIGERSELWAGKNEVAIEDPAPVKQAENTEPKKKRAPRPRNTEVVIQAAVIPEVAPAAVAPAAIVPAPKPQVTLPVEGAPSFLPGLEATANPAVKHTVAEVRTKAINYLTSTKDPMEESQRRVTLSKVLSTCGVKSYDAIPEGKVEEVYAELTRAIN